MLKKNILGILTLVVTAALTGACGDDNVVIIDGRIDVIDIDDDLVVSVPEWNAAFIVFDVNDDAVLTPTEFRFNADAFASADLDRDVFVTEGEWDATLATWDLDDDLLLESDEFDPFL